MHAVFGSVELDPDRASEAETMLQEVLVPGARARPGFVSGTWTRTADTTAGRSCLIFEDEASARDFATSVMEQGPPPGAPVTFGSFEVCQVLAQA